MIKSLKYKILLTLALISLASSIMLSLPQKSSEFCLIREKSCDVIHNTSYNYTFGIQNSYYGILIFTALSSLIYSQIKKPSNKKQKIVDISIIFGSVIALYFLFLQQFILRAYCIYCLITNISILISLVVILTKWKK